MSSIAAELAAVLATVRRPGDFCAAGTTEFLAPRLEVNGVGLIALPLPPFQAERLVAAAERAPYGRGETTLVDPAVRRTWQIGPDRIRIEGKGWGRTLKTILARIAAGLGVTEPIEAEFYKLLIYDEGSFFASHRDTEKAPGMFATLVIVLPSLSTGGELLVRHRGKEARLDLRCPEPSEIAFAAFYADCVHEVLPVTSGCRLTLVYNLLRSKPGRVPEPPTYDRELDRVTELLQSWCTSSGTADTPAPEKLIYPLEHAYTPAEFGFETLKGADAAVATVLVAAAQQSGCDLHLALLSIEESGSAEYTGGYDSYRRWAEPDEDEFEEIEVFDRQVGLSAWRRPDGHDTSLPEIPLEPEELSPPEVLDDLEPDEKHFHEATGNEGATFERTYRRAALVLWPRERFFAVLCQAGLSVTLPYLAALTGHWAASGEGRDSPLWRQAHQLSEQMLSRWTLQKSYPSGDEAPSHAAWMLTLLTELGDIAHIEAALADIAGGLIDKDDNDAIIRALSLLSGRQAAAWIERIIAGTAVTSLSACANLLAQAAAGLRQCRETDFVSAAAALVEALPGDPHRRLAEEAWRWDLRVESGFVVDLLSALGRIDEGLAGRAADHILAWPQTYGLDGVVIPAVALPLKAR